MTTRSPFGERSKKDLLLAVAPIALLAVMGLFFAYKFVNPAPPTKIVISTGDHEGDYQLYAKQYQEIIKDDGVKVELRPSSGAVENLKKLQDQNSDVEVGFVQDGLGSPTEQPDLMSLGSLYYEPIWIFYRGPNEIKRFSELKGKAIAIGQPEGGTHTLVSKILKESGVDETNSKLLNIGWQNATDALKKHEITAAFFLATDDDPLIKKMIADPELKLMSVDQAEALTRQFPFLHHLVLPHGAMGLEKNLPAKDTDMIGPTATLLVKDTIHPAMIYLLLKAASQVHGEPGIFEKKDEFPTDKDYQFPFSEDAKHFYKSGVPFWQKHLPFWIATLADRFILVIIPMIVLILPLIRTIPKLYHWRIRSRIYRRYGELKYLETQLQREPTREKGLEYLKHLDAIEEHVNNMKLPLTYSEHFYSLRGHIDFVRERLRRLTT